MSVAMSVIERELAILSGGCLAFTLGKRKAKYQRMAEDALWRHLFALFMLCGV